MAHPRCESGLPLPGSKPTTPMYAGEAYAPTQTDELLWWLATAEKELIKDCVVDRNRYRIVGMSVLATWIFATLAWTYFFSTVIDNVFLYVGSGVFMGFVILSINGRDVTSVQALSRLLSSVDGTVQVEGIYPGYDGTYRYPLNLDSE